MNSCAPDTIRCPSLVLEYAYESYIWSQTSRTMLKHAIGSFLDNKVLKKVPLNTFSEDSFGMFSVDQ